MMISPEAYYLELKGKPPEELQARIRSLKRQIGCLKNKIENPAYTPEPVCPSDSVRLYMTREYLSMVKKALTEAGGECHESAADRRAAAFLNQLPYLKKITFSIGGFFDGFNEYEIEIRDGLHIVGMHHPDDRLLPLNKRVLIPNEDKVIETPGELCKYLHEMHVEKWRHCYDTRRFGYEVCDGTQWELKFEYYNDHRPWTSSGSNSYPYNFLDLLNLFGEKHPEAEIEDEPGKEGTNEWDELYFRSGDKGSENGIILKDEEYKGSCRITLEKCQRYYGITCGVYGSMMHTAFAGESDYLEKYEAMKEELADFIDHDVDEDEARDFYSYFTEKYR